MKIDTQKIEIIMAKNGWSMTYLSGHAKISRQNLSTILRRGTAREETVQKIANALEITTADLELPTGYKPDFSRRTYVIYKENEIVGKVDLTPMDAELLNRLTCGVYFSFKKELA